MKRLAILLLALPIAANAIPITTTGSGSAVSSPDFSADFDGLPFFGEELSTYTEGGLFIQTPDSAANFNFLLFSEDKSTWYPNGGYDSGTSVSDSLIRIGMNDGSLMSGVEFEFVRAGALDFDLLVWETYLGGFLTGSGSFGTPADRSIVGWLDNDGFDELRVGVFISDPNSPFFDTNETNNPLALDNLLVQAAVTVPEPGTLALLGIGLAGIGFARRRKQA